MRPSPEETLAAIRVALGAELRIDFRHHRIHLRYDDGVLTMEGDLADAASKKLALERAAAVPGVLHIVDRLRTTPAQHMTDGQIRDHVCDALRGESVFQGCSPRARTRAEARAGVPPGTVPSGLEVFVQAGVVTLSGPVPSLAHKRLAGVLAWWVPGTRDVVNGIEVVPAEEDNDDEMRDAVRLALEKDPLVDAAPIRVSAHAGQVTLEGVVASREQSDAAELDAWYVFGVDRVANHLSVRARERITRPT